MIKLTEIIVKRPVAAAVLIAAVVIFGIIALMSMPQELTPELDMPMLIINTIYPNAGPGDVENLVTKPIEDSVNALNGVRTVISRSMENVSMFVIQYEYGTDIRRAYTDVREALDRLTNTLPDDCRTPIVIEMNIDARPNMSLSISSTAQENLLSFVEDEVLPQLEKLSSVSSVDLYGGIEDYVRVEVREELLREYGIGINNVIAALSTVDYSAPLGTTEFGDTDIAVRTEVRYQTINALRSVPITLMSGDIIRLSDVAVVHAAERDADSISRFDGNDDISLGIHKRQSASADRVSRDVTRAIDAIVAANPDISVVVTRDSNNRITTALLSVAQTMALAIALSMLVLFLFFGDMRASLIVGTSMPVSLLITFVFMNFMGYSLNIVSMSGLVIGVGMMVDNAIVVIDSCFKAREKQHSFAEAALKGTQFVMLSIFAATLTTAVVFIPLATIQGMAGQMFEPLGFSIVFALSSSLFSAITLVPLFFVQFKPIERKNSLPSRVFKRVENGYARMLGVLLGKKKTVLAITAVFMVVSVFLATLINFELMPSMDEGEIVITAETKPGLRLEYADEVYALLEEMVASHPDVKNYSLTSRGGGTASMLTGGDARLTATLHSDRKMQTSEIVELWRVETRHMVDVDLDITASTGSDLGLIAVESNVEVAVSGDSLEDITEAVALIEAVMNEHQDILRVSSNLDRSSSRMEIVVDPVKAASKNMPLQMVTAGVYAAINGMRASDIIIDGQNLEIWVEFPQGRYQSVSDLANMMLTSPTGGLIPLSDIASVGFSDTPQTIMRNNGQYMATVTGVQTAAARFTAQEEIDAAVALITFPDGVTIGQTLVSEIMDEEFASMGVAILTGVLLVFMVMAVQFGSIRHSIMVMICIPFAAIGSLMLMFLAGSTLSIVSLLGFLILVGTVVNNGILYVDAVNQYRVEMDLRAALLEAGRTRLRPILMTTLTTILSMLPLAVDFGGGTELMQGLGVTVIGGLSASTLLALLFLPTFYQVVDGNPEKRAMRKRVRLENREKKIMAQML